MSDKARYQSKLGATRKITEANYLVEFIMIRHAAKRDTQLPRQIWNKKKFAKDPQWKYWCLLYHGELARTSKLLEDFSMHNIIHTLENGEGKVILSFANNKIKRLIGDTTRQQKLIEKTKEINEIHSVSADTTPRKQPGTKSKLRKLQ